MSQVWAGSAESVRALVSYDASLSAVNLAVSGDWVAAPGPGCTPLHLAAARGNTSMCRLLLSAYVSERGRAHVPPHYCMSVFGYRVLALAVWPWQACC